ncbi:MAG: radical SAM protein [Candidatus Mcinerneyibacterium aminivorans]|uniref:Radical SAM protein n=1 Tax=Candidatus Mcinerneyibacterium aminivorans TaxID=2703815 RepID=A0A5D0MEE9_9BACT|nr:MAG: radical SAM protein [Candidatus Mcinerneyibacterium aminivorans]
MGVNNFDKVKKNIRKICENDINLRIATILVDEESYNEFPEMVEFANKVGALSISGSPVIPIGRGEKLMDNYSISFETIKKHSDNLIKMSKKYPELDLGIMDKGDISQIKNEGNCGIGWKTYFINPNGKPKLCGFFPEKYSSNLIKNEKIRKQLFNIDAPKKKYCRNCKNFNFCKYCILRGWLKAVEEGFKNCKWIQNNEELIDIMNKLERY